MIVLQILISVLIPALMVLAGRSLKRRRPAYPDAKGFAFRTKAAKASEEAWAYANHMFAGMLVAAGINVGAAAAVFMIAVSLVTQVNGWLLALLLADIEAAGAVLPGLMTQIFLLKRFDAQGKPLQPAEEAAKKEF